MPDYAPCPNCGSNEIERVGFSWWGGVIGPKLLNHVKCRSCNSKYNGKTGESNTKGIIIYSVIACIIAFIIFFFIGFMLNS